MLEINAASFVDIVGELRRVHTVIDSLGSEDDRSQALEERVRSGLAQTLEQLVASTVLTGARATTISAGRILENIRGNADFTYGALLDGIRDVESRFRDELSLVRLFVVDANTSGLFQAGTALVGPLIADNFPSAIFDYEESGKCAALGRATACVFHLMRILEIGIKSLCSFLQCPEPTSPAERNWAIMLRNIKAQMDAKWPAKLRLPGTVGANLESAYATLDAVKNPWRNATMHVEGVYTDAEAAHIMQSVHNFMQRLSGICNEAGVAPAAS